MAFNLKHKLISQYSKFISPQKIIIVTGSVGKSSALLACEDILVSFSPIVSVSDSLLNHPQALLKMTPKTNRGLFEVKLDHPGDVNQVLNLIKPEVLIITNVYEGQSELSIDQQVEEYVSLISALPKQGAVILNWDDPILRRLSQNSKAEVIFYGTEEKKCHLWAGNIQISQFRVIFELNYGVERVEIKTNFMNKSQIYSFLAASALGVKEGLRLTQIKSKLEKIKPPSRKMEIIPGFSGSTIIDASFDGHITTTVDAIESLNLISARRRILVLGSMRGSDLEKSYRKIARTIYQEKIDLIFIARGEAQTIVDELLKLGFISDRLEQDLTNPQIVSGLLKVLAKGDVVLVKGAKEVRLDEVVAKITRK